MLNYLYLEQENKTGVLPSVCMPEELYSMPEELETKFAIYKGV